MPSDRRGFVGAFAGLGSVLLGGCAATASNRYGEETPTSTPTRATGDRLSTEREVETYRLDDRGCGEVAADAVGEAVTADVEVEAVWRPESNPPSKVSVRLVTYYDRDGREQSTPPAFETVTSQIPATADVTLTHDGETHECAVPVVVRHVDVRDT